METKYFSSEQYCKFFISKKISQAQAFWNQTEVDYSIFSSGTEATNHKNGQDCFFSVFFFQSHQRPKQRTTTVNEKFR